VLVDWELLIRIQSHQHNSYLFFFKSPTLPQIQDQTNNTVSSLHKKVKKDRTREGVNHFTPVPNLDVVKHCQKGNGGKERSSLPPTTTNSVFTPTCWLMKVTQSCKIVCRLQNGTVKGRKRRFLFLQSEILTEGHIRVMQGWKVCLIRIRCDLNKLLFSSAEDRWRQR